MADGKIEHSPTIPEGSSKASLSTKKMYKGESPHVDSTTGLDKADTSHSSGSIKSLIESTDEKKNLAEVVIRSLFSGLPCYQDLAAAEAAAIIATQEAINRVRRLRKEGVGKIGEEVYNVEKLSNDAIKTTEAVEYANKGETEHARSLLRLRCLKWVVLEPSDKGYKHFTSCQTDSNSRLRLGSFRKFRKFVALTLSSKERRKNELCSSFGDQSRKNTKYRYDMRKVDALAAYLGGKLDAFGFVDKDGKPTNPDAKDLDKHPTLKRLSSENKRLICEAARVGYAFVQLVQGECVAGSFPKGISQEALRFQLIRSFFDAAAAMGHEVSKGSAVMTEPTFEGYKAALRALKPEMADRIAMVNSFLDMRADQLNILYHQEPKVRRVVTRLTLMSRQTTPEGAKQVVKAFKKLAQETRELLQEELLKNGINDLAIFPFQGPTFLKMKREATPNQGVEALVYSFEALAEEFCKKREEISSSAENGLYTLNLHPEVMEERNEREHPTKKLTIVITDFGADWDDQKAFSGLLTGMKEKLQKGEIIAAIVCGPQPREAAACIRQKYYHEAGQLPLIAEGTQFEADNISEEQVYSLVDGEPIINSKAFLNIPSLSLKEFHQKIAHKIRKGNIKHIEFIVLAPLHKGEYFNPESEALKNDPEFQEKWRAVSDKKAIMQFLRTPEKKYRGNNYNKSEAGVPEEFLAMLARQDFKQAFVDGAIAKRTEFLVPMEQPEQLGIQRAMETYMTCMQSSWFYMTWKLGETPSAEEMYVGMFASHAEVPFGVHVSGQDPAGFGAERGMKEICGISKDNLQYEAVMQPIEEELTTFDKQILRKLKKTYPDVKTLQDMKTKMHTAMMDALQQFGRQKNILTTDEEVKNFKELFDKAAEKNIKLNAYRYMEEFKTVLFETSPLVKAITALADAEKDQPRPSHRKSIATTLGESNARGVPYDAVTEHIASIIFNSKNLEEYFIEDDEVLVIHSKKIERMEKEKPNIWANLQNGVREVLINDGCRLEVKYNDKSTI